MHKMAQGLSERRRFNRYPTWFRDLGFSLATRIQNMTFGMLESTSRSLVWDRMTKHEWVPKERTPVIDDYLGTTKC